MTDLDLSIIIVAYNCRELLLRCLASLYPPGQPWPRQVIVVDNGSADDTLAAVQAAFPQVLAFPAGGNVGFSRANNLAMRRARGRYVLLLNPDTEVRPGALAELVRFAEAHPGLGAVGPRLTLPDGRLDRACRRGFPTPLNALCYFAGLSRLFPRSRLLCGYQLTYLPEHETAAVDSLCGAAMLVPAAIIEQVGPLDEQFFMFGEDIDWCYRIRQAGYPIYYHPAARVLHRKGGSGRSPRVRYEFFRAMWLFYRKHYARSGAAPLAWLVMAGIGVLGAAAVAGAWLRRLAPGRPTGAG